MQNANLKSIVETAVEDAKGKDIVVMDVRGLTSITDYMVIVSGTSDRHVKAIADHVVERVKAQGYRPLGIEGERAAEWILVDIGDVVVHVMKPRTREFYKLERLWSADKHSRDSAEA